MATIFAPPASPVTAELPTPPSRPSLFNGFKEWLLKRGILFGLLQTPILAFFVGTLFRFVSTQFATFIILIAFILLPLWITYRKRVSTDPTEPVHHLPKFALYALIPFVTFSVVRIPLFYILGFVYWGPWYRFGAEATGEPAGHFSSLIPGAMLYTLQGYSLGLGFYVLFKRHSLLNAVLFFGLYISALYSYAFPEYLLVGAQPGFNFQFSNYLGHICMGIAAWFMPVFWTKLWPKLAMGAKVGAVSLLIAWFVAPYAFAFGGAAVWQFGEQTAIDQTTFNRPNLLVAQNDLKVSSSGSEARYEFSLKFGPRSYQNYAHNYKALDAGPVVVEGRLVHQGETIAWCNSRLDKVASPNGNKVPRDHLGLIKKMDYTNIPVSCVGTVASAGKLEPNASIEVQWQANLTLVGDREKASKVITGIEQMPVKQTLALNNN
jgi:hypothetical protein